MSDRQVTGNEASTQSVDTDVVEELRQRLQARKDHLLATREPHRRLLDQMAADPRLAEARRVIESTNKELGVIDNNLAKIARGNPANKGLKAEPGRLGTDFRGGGAPQAPPQDQPQAQAPPDGAGQGEAGQPQQAGEAGQEAPRSSQAQPEPARQANTAGQPQAGQISGLDLSDLPPHLRREIEEVRAALAERARSREGR